MAVRVLQEREVERVGGKSPIKVDVRVIATTNRDMHECVANGTFREDLYYHLSTVEIHLPPLRKRPEDIPLLFRKFAADFGQKYRMPPLRLDETAQQLLVQYHWKGNIRQLRNVAEQISVLEKEREINAPTLRAYLPEMGAQLPAVVQAKEKESDFSSEREILYKVLFDMKSDLNDLKKLTLEMINNGGNASATEESKGLIQKIYGSENPPAAEPSEKLTLIENESPNSFSPPASNDLDRYDFVEAIEEEPLSLLDKEIEMIKRALERSKGKRKQAAAELGISERTLYRKIKQYDLNEDETV